VVFCATGRISSWCARLRRSQVLARSAFCILCMAATRLAAFAISGREPLSSFPAPTALEAIGGLFAISRDSEREVRVCRGIYWRRSCEPFTDKHQRCVMSLQEFGSPRWDAASYHLNLFGERPSQTLHERRPAQSATQMTKSSRKSLRPQSKGSASHEVREIPVA
jgi:hypothetical protein